MRLSASPRRDELSSLTISRNLPYHTPYDLFFALALAFPILPFEPSYTSLQISSAASRTPCLILSGRTSSHTAGKHRRGSRPLSLFVLLGKLLQRDCSKLGAFFPHPPAIPPFTPFSANLVSPEDLPLFAAPRSSRKPSFSAICDHLSPKRGPMRPEPPPSHPPIPLPPHLPSHSLNSPSRLLLIIPTGKLLTISLTFSFTPSLSPALAA